MSGPRRIVLLAVVLVQLAVPLALAGIAAADLAFGREIRLRAQPLDPLDIFRGNYVVLGYEISTVDVPVAVSRGQRLCVPLTEIGGAWTGRYGLPERVSGDTVICGRARRDAGAGERVAVEYGIETFYANTERAREIERSIARGTTFAVVDLDDDGSARIERLEFEPSG